MLFFIANLKRHLCFFLLRAKGGHPGDKCSFLAGGGIKRPLLTFLLSISHSERSEESFPFQFWAYLNPWFALLIKIGASALTFISNNSQMNSSIFHGPVIYNSLFICINTIKKVFLYSISILIRINLNNNKEPKSFIKYIKHWFYYDKSIR